MSEKSLDDLAREAERRSPYPPGPEIRYHTLSPTKAYPFIDTRKIESHVPISCCLLTDSTGRNHCDHPPYEFKPQPWRTRLRWNVERIFTKTRARIGFAIAGYDPRDEYY